MCWLCLNSITVFTLLLTMILVANFSWGMKEVVSEGPSEENGIESFHYFRS